MLARWRPCSTTSGELYRRYCANKKENAGRVANYLRHMGTIWRPLSRPKVMMMGQIAYLDAYGSLPPPVTMGCTISTHSCGLLGARLDVTDGSRFRLFCWEDFAGNMSMAGFPPLGLVRVTTVQPMKSPPSVTRVTRVLARCMVRATRWAMPAKAAS